MTLTAARLALFLDVADLAAGRHFAIAPHNAAASECRESQEPNQTHRVLQSKPSNMYAARLATASLTTTWTRSRCQGIAPSLRERDQITLRARDAPLLIGFNASRAAPEHLQIFGGKNVRVDLSSAPSGRPRLRGMNAKTKKKGRRP